MICHASSYKAPRSREGDPWAAWQKVYNSYTNDKLGAGVATLLNGYGVSFNGTVKDDDMGYGAVVTDLSFSIIQAAANILKSGDTEITGPKIYEHVKKLDYKGPSGRVTYDDNGDRIGAFPNSYYYNMDGNMDSAKVIDQSKLIMKFVEECEAGDGAATVPFACPVAPAAPAPAAPAPAAPAP